MYDYPQFANEENQSLARLNTFLKVTQLVVQEPGWNLSLSDYRLPTLLCGIFPSQELMNKRVQFPFICTSGVRVCAVHIHWPKSTFTFPALLLGKIGVCLHDRFRHARDNNCIYSQCRWEACLESHFRTLESVNCKLWNEFQTNRVIVVQTVSMLGCQMVAVVESLYFPWNPSKFKKEKWRHLSKARAITS